MTREEAVTVAHKYYLAERHIEYLEALGLLKFDEPKPVDKLADECNEVPSNKVPSNEVLKMVTWIDTYGNKATFSARLNPNDYSHLKWFKLEERPLVSNTFNISEVAKKVEEISNRQILGIFDTSRGLKAEQIVDRLREFGYKIVPID